MKKEKKILICSVLNQLAEKRDPFWKTSQNRLFKFKELYYSWRETDLRHKHRNPQFYTKCWKRGWMPEADFKRFREYAMQ